MFFGHPKSLFLSIRFFVIFTSFTFMILNYANHSTCRPVTLKKPGFLAKSFEISKIKELVCCKTSSNLEFSHEVRGQWDFEILQFFGCLGYSEMLSKMKTSPLHYQETRFFRIFYQYLSTELNAKNCKHIFLIVIGLTL